MTLLASSDGLVFDILVVLLTVAFYLVGVHVAVGVLVVPVWALGALLRVRWLRAAILWWALPWLIAEWSDGFWSRLTAPRDSSRWRREPAPAREPRLTDHVHSEALLPLPRAGSRLGRTASPDRRLSNGS